MQWRTRNSLTFHISFSKNWEILVKKIGNLKNIEKSGQTAEKRSKIENFYFKNEER